MSIVVLTPNLLGRDGISHLSRLIVRACDDVRVIALHEPASCSHFEHAAVDGAAGRPARFASLALQTAASIGPGATVLTVHIHLAPAALAFAARGASLVTWLCGIEAWTPLTWTQRAALQRSRRVLAISRHTLDRFVEANPKLAERDIAVCHPGIANADALERASSAPRALIVGRMASDERYKGHDSLIDVWPQVARQVPGASLEIVGEGDDRARLEAKAAALGVGGLVTFVGSAPDAARDAAYDRCAVLAMPSRDEGFGLVFLEAMRAARACIAGRGAASEIIDDGRTGCLIENGEDRAALVGALVSTLGDPALAADMGRRGRERFLERFTEEHFRERLSALVPEAARAGARA